MGGLNLQGLLSSSLRVAVCTLEHVVFWEMRVALVAWALRVPVLSFFFGA
jgi:hypothetical protein